MQIVEQPNEFHIRIDYNRFRTRNSNQVKAIPGVRFDWNRKIYIAPATARESLKAVQAKCHAEWITIATAAPEQFGELQVMPELDFDINLQAGTMRPYQGNGVARGLELKRFLNGDEQGLGKTLQSIATIYGATLKGEITFPCLVICPSSTKINWQREWKQ